MQGTEAWRLMDGDKVVTVRPQGRFKADNGCDRLVMVWCGSTEAYQEPSEVHVSVAAFEQGLKDNDANISPSQI